MERKDAKAALERMDWIKENNIISRLNNIKMPSRRDYLIGMVYSCFPDRESKMINTPFIDLLSQMPLELFQNWVETLEYWEEKIKDSSEDELEVIVPHDEKAESIKQIKQKLKKVTGITYISFTVARYVLTDVIEELHKSNAKDIIVTKEDDNLVVKYKPYWKA